MLEEIISWFLGRKKVTLPENFPDVFLPSCNDHMDHDAAIEDPFWFDISTDDSIHTFDAWD